jgi:hypothetical protein
MKALLDTSFKRSLLPKSFNTPRDSQLDVPSAEVASQARSILSPFSGKGSEISLPYGNLRAVKDALKPVH